MLSIALLLVSACSKVESSLLDSVPASAQVVAVVDVDLLLKRAGCQVDNGKIQLSPELRRLVDTPQEFSSAVSRGLDVISDFYGAVDLSEIVFVSMKPVQNGDEAFLTFMVSDKGAVATKMNEAGVKNSGQDDVDIYAGEDWTLAIRDGQGWLLPDHLDADKVRSCITAPDHKESIGAQSGIVDFLNSDNAANIAVLADGFTGVKDDSGLRACIGVKVEDSVIGMHMQLIAPDGAVTDFAENYQEISTDFLNYVPGSYAAAAAVGIGPDFDWSSLAGMAMLAGGRDAASAMQIALPFLSKIDGTVAIAVGPAGGAPAIADVNLNTWNFLVMAHMKQGDVDTILDQLNMLAPQIGARPVKMEQTQDNVDAWQLPDGTVIYIGNVDGYLAISNEEFRPTGENSMTETFLSKRAALAINVPAGSEIVKAFDMPWGFNASMQIDKSELHIRFSLNGTDKSVLQALLAELLK